MFFRFFKNLYHGKSEIKKSTLFSIDIQPFGELILTCGQDWLIKIWSLTNPNIEQNPIATQQKNFQKKEIYEWNFIQLEIIEIHQGPVNIVRWACDGKKFASGADDGSTIIFESTKNPFGKKNWRPFHIFKNHFGDVTDLSWSPNCSLLASASLDRNVFVYSIHNKNAIMKLSNYSFWVKAVSWDPHGIFLATQSENGKVIIWKTFSWESEQILNLASKNKNLKTKKNIQLFNRLTWTICGRFLLISNCFLSKKGNTVLAFDRLSKFSRKISFNGNKSPVNSIRCSPRLYQKKANNLFYSLSVFGSMNGKLDLWKSGNPRILFSIKNLIKKQILDFSWTINGYDLFISSIGGDIFSISFSPRELGKVVSKVGHFCFLKSIQQQFYSVGILKIFSTSMIFSILKKNIKRLSFREIEKKKDFYSSYFKKKEEKKNTKKKLKTKRNLKPNGIQVDLCDKSTIFQVFKKKKRIWVFWLQKCLVRIVLINPERTQKKLIDFYGRYFPLFFNEQKNFSILLSKKRKKFFIEFVNRIKLKKKKLKLNFQVNYLVTKNFFLILRGIEGNFLIIDLKKKKKVYNWSEFHYPLRDRYHKFFQVGWIFLKCSGFIDIIF